MKSVMFRPVPMRRSCKGLRFFFQLLTFYLSLVLLLCFSPWLQRQLIYLHWINYPFVNVTEPSLLKNLHPLHVSHLFIHTEDHVRLGAWHVCLRSPCRWSMASKVFLYFHGNAGHRGTPHRVQIYKELLAIEPEAQVLTFDYRGYGDSDFHLPTNATMWLDALAAWRYLLAQRVLPSHIHFVAHSLGTGISTNLARHLSTKPSSMVLLAPYTDLVSAAASHPLVFPVPFLVKPFMVDHFDNHAIANLNLPILLIHGTWDLTIPVSHSHTLLAMSCPTPPHAIQHPSPCVQRAGT